MNNIIKIIYIVYFKGYYSATTKCPYILNFYDFLNKYLILGSFKPNYLCKLEKAQKEYE